MKHCKFTFFVILVVGLFSSVLYSQTTNPRTPAEFEETKGVVVRWDEKEYYKIFLAVQSSGWTSYYLDRYYSTMNTQTTIIKEALNEGLEAYVIDDTSKTGKYGPWLYSDYHVLDTLIKLGVPSSSHLHIIPYPALDDAIEKVWVRDWGPYNIYNNGVGAISMAGRSLDTTIAAYLPKPFVTTTVFDGGNFLTDGHGRLIADQNQTYINQPLFGVNDLVVVANYKIHVDYYMKLVDEETFVVSYVPSSNYGTNDSFFGDSVALEGAISVMKTKTSCFGRPYKFVRIKNAPSYSQNGLSYITSEAGYANSLILNKTVLVPTYSNPATDTVAINTYKRIMPGYRIVGVPSRYYAARQGAVHCITKEFAADNPIFIAHAWLPDTTQNTGSGYLIKAYIKTTPGVSHAEVNWSMNPQGGFQSIPMTQAVGDTFTATIPVQASGGPLSYYISATAVGGKQMVKPVVAPTGYYSTYLKGAVGPCVIVCPANISVSNSTGQCGAIVNYPAPTTTGNCGIVTSLPASGTLFPIGTTTVNCSTASGPSCSFTVTVIDTQKPTIACPSNITVAESSPGSGSAIVNYAAPTVSDNCPGFTVTSLPATGSSFPVGTTTVKCKVTDASGNKDSCSFIVTVNSLAICQITCPANISVKNAPGQCGATVTYAAPITTGPCGIVTSTPASGTFFPIGTTTVNCSVASGPSCSFTVTVNDTQKPTIACVSNITVAESSPGSGSAIVSYAAPTISDNCPGVAAISTPSSGSSFPVGTTIVKSIVTDASGNKDSCSFTVTVTSSVSGGGNGSLALRDDFNRAATTDLGTSPAPYKWVKLANQPNASASIQLNADGTISPINTSGPANFGGVAWDSLMTDTTQMALIVRQKGGNGSNSSFFIYFRMNGKTFTTGNGYRMEYYDNPSGLDELTLQTVTNGISNVFLATLRREIAVGDTLVARVEANKTMKAFVFGTNGVRDSISLVDNTYNPSQWYCWLRGCVFATPVKLDNFMIGKLNQSTPAVPLFSVAPGGVSFGTVGVGANKQDSVTVTNTGTGSLIISNVAADNGQFSVSPTSATITSGATRKFYITFTPTSVAAANGNIIFTHNAAGSPGSASVSGTGGVPAFGVSPLTISYGNIVAGFTKQDSVVVSNSGTITLTISSVISDSGQFSVTPTSGSIAPSGSQKFYITFAPTSTGAKSGHILFTHNASGSPGIVAVNGTGIVSPFAVAPSSIAFGNVVVGLPKQDSLTVSNNGATTLTITSVTTDNGQFSVTPSSGLIAPSASTTFYVTFTPTSAGGKSGNVIFNHSAPGSPTNVPVSGTGIAPVFSVNTSNIAFGNVTLGTNKQDSVTVTNTGTAPLVISSVNADSAQFTVTPSSGTIPPSGNQKFYITFTPGTSVTTTGHVGFVHNANGSPGVVTVIGTGVTPGFSVAPASITFGNVNVGSNKKDSLTVTNTGAASLTISSATSDNGQFTVTPTSGVLSPSGSLKFYVTFTPASANAQTGNISFTYNASGSPRLVPVSGTGVAPVFSVNPATIAFGNVTLGSNKQDSVTVTNTGTAPLIISTVGSNNAQFTFTPTGGTIAPSGSQKYYVTFAPASSGLQSGTISFTHNASGSPGTVDINGTGVVPTTPVIASFTPASAPVGTAITINGSNFNTTPSANIVFFGAVKATVSTATSTALTVTVPSGATYFPISVETNGLVAYSVIPFIVTFPSSNVIDTSSFAARVDFNAGNQPFGVSVGDVDGDGKPDIQAANINTVSVMRNLSTTGVITTGSFAPQVVLNAGSDAYIPFMGDLDGDGKLDLLVTNNLANTISIYRNISTPGSIGISSFAAELDLATGSGPQGVYIRDVDGDGRPDLIVANNASNTVSIWRNVGSPGSLAISSFAPRLDFATSTTPRLIEMGDVDGDGKIDIITPNLNGNNVSVLRNTSIPGTITFAAHVDFATGSGPKSCMLGDLDGDGKPDLAVAHYNTNTICVLRNTSVPGTISFAPHFDYVTGNAARSVVMTDVSGDGKLDLEIVNQTSGTLSIMKNIATPGTINASSFAAPVNFTTGLKPIFLAVTDFDGDGKPDVVINNANNNTVSVFKNKVPAPPAGTSVSTRNTQLETPTTYSLGQNYPNPFNPVTTISYTLPEHARVTLRLYNTLGQEIATLVDGVENAGYKSVQFDAGSLPSGVYFYHLNASGTEDATHNFSQVRKMLLMK